MEKELQLLIEKYVGGDNLQLNEIQLVESNLEQNNTLVNEIANSLSSMELNSDTLIGIDYWASNKIKQDITKVEHNLYQQGFFINYEIIDQYLSGTLDGELLGIFEKRLEVDDSFAKEVAHQADIIQGIEVFSEKNIKSDLNKIQTDLESKGFSDEEKDIKTVSKPSPQKEAKVVSFGVRKMLAYAASVLLIALAGFWLFNNGDSSESIYANNFQPYEDVLTEDILDELESFGFGGESKKDQLKELQQCMEFYENKSYEASNTALKNYLKKYPNDNEAKFYQAISLMETENFNQAEPILLSLSQLDNSKFQKEANWFLALSYLKNKKMDSAKALLENISNNNDSPYKTKSQKILKNI